MELICIDNLKDIVEFLDYKDVISLNLTSLSLNHKLKAINVANLIRNKIDYVIDQKILTCRRYFMIDNSSRENYEIIISNSYENVGVLNLDSYIYERNFEFLKVIQIVGNAQQHFECVYLLQTDKSYLYSNNEFDTLLITLCEKNIKFKILNYTTVIKDSAESLCFEN